VQLVVYQGTVMESGDCSCSCIQGLLMVAASIAGPDLDGGGPGAQLTTVTKWETVKA